MEALDNKCPACGAKIKFNPVNQMWDCEYCGSKFSLEEMQKHENASTSKANEVTSKPEKKLEEMDVYRCKNCGAEIMADKNTTSTFCLYCGSTAILKDRINEGRAPNYIIPFKNVKNDAVEAFKKLLKKKKLAPKCFKDPKNIEKITGVYIPFWAYDITSDGRVKFSAIDTSTWSDSNYHYTKTSTYHVEMTGHFDFNKILVDASSRFPDDLMDSLEPFDYSQLVEYNHAYLSGFLAEKYDVAENDAKERAVFRSNNTSIAMLKTKIGHQSSTVMNNALNFDTKKVHYIMLPVWMVNVQYKNKNYTFAMNGQTGKIIGNIPIGFKETVFWTLLIFAISFVISFIVIGLV